MAIVLLLLLIPIPAFAYLDPSAGGGLHMILGPILAMIMAGWLFLKQRFAQAMAAVKRWLASRYFRILRCTDSGEK